MGWERLGVTRHVNGVGSCEVERYMSLCSGAALMEGDTWNVRRRR